MPTFVEKIRLLKGLLSQEHAYAGPFIATIDLTQRCNLQCPGCYVHSPLLKLNPPESQGDLRDIPLDLFEDVCSQLREIGTREIDLIGYGEPFFHPEFTKCLKIAKDTGAVVRVITNGTRINGTTIPALIDSRLDKLQVSLWATSPEYYVRSYPGTNPDMFHRVVDGVRQLADEKKKRGCHLPKLIMHYPISKKNYEAIEETADFARQTGFDSLSFTPFRNWEGKLSSLALSPSEEKQAIQALKKTGRTLDKLSIGHNIAETMKRYQIGEAVLDASACYVGWVHIRVCTDGTVLPCYLCPIGNVRQKPLKEIWSGSSMQQFRKRMINRTNLTEITSQGKCGYCYHAIENAKIDRIFRWFPTPNRS